MEKHVHVHDFSFHLKFSRGQLQTFLALIFVCAFASGLSPESVTLSTYYPAPAGVYNNMVTIGDTWLARDPVPSTGQPSFVELGSNAAVSNGTKLAIMNGNVGIGTTSPATALDVNGGIRPGAATTGGFCATQGALGYDYTAKAPVYCGPAVGINGYPHWTSYSGASYSHVTSTYWNSTPWCSGGTMYYQMSCPTTSPGGCTAYMQQAVWPGSGYGSAGLTSFAPGSFVHAVRTGSYMVYARTSLWVPAGGTYWAILDLDGGFECAYTSFDMAY